MSIPLNKLIDLEKDARAFGFDWPNSEMIVDQAVSECEEVREAILNNESPNRIQEEIGDVIHTGISLCLFAGFDVEETISMVAAKFAERMQNVKNIAHQRGMDDLRGQSTENLISIWQEAKKHSTAQQD